MRFSKEYKGRGFRVTKDNYDNIISFYPRWGLALNIEFPSDWHEDGQGCLSFCFIYGMFYLHFPWYKTYEDHHQCSGPRYGFSLFTEDKSLFIYYGNETGTNSKLKILYGPWDWNAYTRKKFKHEILTEPETHEYTYVLNNGKVQSRKATIYHERRTWHRYWLPSKMVRDSINVEFDDEVGERTGSWKGGTIGCSWDLLEGETSLQALIRMERHRKF